MRSAADEYKRYALKADQVYQTCLPFLRKTIAALYAFVGCEPTATWPDLHSDWQQPTVLTGPLAPRPSTTTVDPGPTSARLAPAQPVAPAERGVGRRDMDPVDFDMRDLHADFLFG